MLEVDELRLFKENDHLWSWTDEYPLPVGGRAVAKYCADRGLPQHALPDVATEDLPDDAYLGLCITRKREGATVRLLGLIRPNGS